MVGGTVDDETVLEVDSGIEALRASPEFEGAVETLEPRHARNDHIALFYESREEQLATIVPFLRQGIARGERCMCVTDDLADAEIVEALRAGGVDVDEALASGALTFYGVEETYLRNGDFDPDEMVEFYADCIAEATEEFSALRVTAETSWLHAERPVTVEEFMTYEAKINDLFEGEDCIALCQYERNAFEPTFLRDVVRSHPHLIYDGTLCHNLYYTPPAEFVGADRADEEVERMVGTLVDRANARAALQERERNLRELYEITADREAAFADKIERLLSFGRRRFGLDQGYLVDVHPDETVEIVAAVGQSDEDVRTGIPAVQPDEGQFCRRAIELDRPIGAADVSEYGWADDPLYEESGVQSYLGVAVTDGDGIYGTLAFCDTTARERAFADAEYTILELMGQWVSHELIQRRRRTQLAALNEMGREIMSAETRAGIADRTVAHADGGLGLPVTAIVTYDGESGDLTTAAQTPRAVDELPTTALGERPDGPLWEAFVAGEARRIESVGDVYGSGETLTEALAVPLGRQGLLVVATAAPEGVDRGTREFVETTAATVEAAYTRADRERQLHHREARLAAQNETLERLNRVNDIIRNIDQALVGAASREEIEAVVCEQLAEVGPYELAWIGEHDPVAGQVTPKEVAGAGDAFMHEVSADDAPEGGGPIGHAVATGEVQVVNDVVEDRTFEPWRQSALNRGYHACIGLPLAYGETCYGVLVVCAGQPGVFDDLERTVLTEMADTIAYAINAVESKKAIVSDEVTRLTFDVGEADLGVLELARQFDCELALESLVPGPGGELRAFVSTSGLAPAPACRFAEELPVNDVRLVAEDDTAAEPFALYELDLTDRSLFATALEHGGRPCAFAVSADAATLTIELAVDAAVREFVRMFRSTYPGIELVAQHTRERPQQTPAEFFSGLVETLTDRQFEALQLAHYSGYLEEPRRQTATDLAEAMDITQPTFNSHLRAAHRTLCEQLFEDRSRPG